MPELDLEVAIYNDWVRFWFQGELQLLPNQLLGRMRSMQDQLDAEHEQLQIVQAKFQDAQMKL